MLLVSKEPSREALSRDPVRFSISYELCLFLSFFVFRVDNEE